jgi:hypothetical protein
MTRRKTKKDRKKHLKEDQFRESMLTVLRQIKEYRYLVLLGAAIVVLLFVLITMRTTRREKELSRAVDLISPNRLAGPLELKNLSKKVAGEPIEPWVLVRYGTKLYDLHQKEDFLKGDKKRLNEAKKVFEDVVARFPDAGSPTYVARKALELIERELPYEPSEGLRKAQEPTPGQPRRPARPKRQPRPRTPPKKAAKPKMLKPPEEEKPPMKIEKPKPAQAPEKGEPAAQPRKPEAPKPPQEQKLPAKPGEAGGKPEKPASSGRGEQK